MTDLSHLHMFLAREGVTMCKSSSTSELILAMWCKAGQHGITWTRKRIIKLHIKMNTSLGPVSEYYTSTMYLTSLWPQYSSEDTHTLQIHWTAHWLHQSWPLIHPMPPIYTAANTFPVVSSYSLLLRYSWQTGGQLNSHCFPPRSRV